MFMSVELNTSSFPALAPKISPSAELQITPEISVAAPELHASAPFSRIKT